MCHQSVLKNKYLKIVKCMHYIRNHIKWTYICTMCILEEGREGEAGEKWKEREMEGGREREAKG